MYNCQIKHMKMTPHGPRRLRKMGYILKFLMNILKSILPTVRNNPPKSNTTIRLLVLAWIAFISLSFLIVTLILLSSGKLSDDVSVAILITSLANIIVAIIGVMAGTSLDSKGD